MLNLYHFTFSIINLLDKVSAPCIISKYIISSRISHYHGKVFIGIKQKQMAEEGGSNILATKWSIKDGYEAQEKELFSALPYFGIPSTTLLQTSSLFVQ